MEEIISSISNELSELNTPMQIAQKRMEDYPNNSIVWCCTNLYQLIDQNGIETKIKWEIDKVLDNRKNNEKKCKFTKEFLETNEGKFQIECIFCGEVKPFYLSSPSSSDMFTHIIKNHNEIVKSYKKKQKKEYCSYSKNKDEFVAKAHTLLASSIITSHSSFTLLENEYFITLLKHLNEDYIPPSRTTLSEKIIPEMAEKIKEKIKHEINDCDGLCLSIDGWCTPYTHFKLFSVTCHFLKKKEIVSRILKLSPFLESSTAENISKFIKEAVEEWSLNRFGPLVILSDNAPDVISGIKLSNNIPIGCCCHRYNLTIESIVNESETYKQLIDKCKKISYKFKNSYEMNNMMYKIQEEMYGYSLNMLSECETRWFFELQLLNRVLENCQITNGIVEAKSDEIQNDLLRECYKENYMLNEIEIELINFFISMMNKMFEESLFLESEIIGTLSYVIPGYYSLMEFYEKEKEKLIDTCENYDYKSYLISVENKIFRSFDEFETSIQTSMETNKNDIQISIDNQRVDLYEIKIQLIEKIKEKMKEKFEEKNNIMENQFVLLACVFNPLFKMDYFGAEEEKIVNDFFSDIDFINENDVGKYSLGRKKRSKSKNEFESYIEEGCISEKSNFEDVLDYWEGKKNIFPNLYKLSKKFLCL